VPLAGQRAHRRLHEHGRRRLGGGEYIYPDSGKYLITSDVAQNAWHISGNIGTYSGFGLYFDNCTHVDASAYGGISFKISGSVAQGDTITMTIGTLADVIPSSWLDAGHGGDGTVKPGRCIPASGATTQYDQSTCVNATKVVPVTDTPTTQAIMWDQFSGGKPEMSVTASDIVTIAWAFPAPPGAGGDNPTTYAADIVIDDLAFIPR
jgi:hypothetical protein